MLIKVLEWMLRNSSRHVSGLNAVPFVSFDGTIIFTSNDEKVKYLISNIITSIVFPVFFPRSNRL